MKEMKPYRNVLLEDLVKMKQTTVKKYVSKHLNNSYEKVHVEDGFVYAEGTYTRGEKDATYYGYTQLDLGTATYVHLDTDIYNHMFALSIDSETSTFPAEQPGGMKINTKEDFINMYGVFGKRFIRHQVTVTETAKENWIDIESDIVVVE